MTENRSPRGLRLYCTAVLIAGILALVFAEGWLVANLPTGRPWGGPDEPMHVSVARYIAEHLQWPRWDNPELVRYRNGASYATASSFNYLLEGIFIRLTARMRISSILLFFTLLAALVAVTRKSRLTALVAVALLVPQTVFIFGYVNAEPWTVVVATFLGIAAARFVSQPDRTVNLILLFAAAGACISCRFHLWALGLIVFLYVLLPRLPRLLRDKPGALAIALLVGTAIAAWWPVTSYIVNDGDIIGRQASRWSREKFGDPVVPNNAVSLKHFPVAFFTKLTTQSFYGRWGWNNLPLPLPLYWIAALLVLPLIVALWALERRFVLLYIMLFFVNLVLLLIYSTTYDLQPQGRYFFASYFLMAGLMLRDLSSRKTLESRSRRTQWILALWLTAVLAVNLFSFTKLGATTVRLQTGLVENGQALLRAGRMEEAKSLFEAAISENPEDSRPYQGLGLIHIQQNDLDEAERTLRIARDLDPDDELTRLSLGSVYIRKADFETAIQELHEALRLAPGSPQVHYHLAVAYAESGQLDDARVHNQKALDYSPRYEPALRLREHLQSTSTDDR